MHTCILPGTWAYMHPYLYTRMLSYIYTYMRATVSQADRAPHRHGTPRSDDRSNQGGGVVARTHERPRGRSLPKWDHRGDMGVSSRPAMPPLPPPPAVVSSKWGLMDVSGLAQQVCIYATGCLLIYLAASILPSPPNK